MVDLWRAVYRNDLHLLKKYLNNKDLKRVIYSRNRSVSIIQHVLLIDISEHNKNDYIKSNSLKWTVVFSVKNIGLVLSRKMCLFVQ